MKKYISIFISLLMFFPPSALAAARTFKPKIAGFTGSMEFNTLYEENKSKSSTYSAQSKDTALREVLKIGANGYVYHPNLVSFLLKASEALEQEKIEKDNSKGDWRQATSEAYEARAYVLPTHPYNMEVFSSLSKPLIAGNLAGNNSGRSHQRHGTFLRYAKRPLSSSLNWTYDRLKSRLSTLKNNTYWTDASLSTFTYLHGSARYANSLSSAGDGGENTYFSLGNQHSLNIFSLNSGWQQNENNTVDRNANTNRIRGRTWSETLSMPIRAWQLSPSVSYSVGRSKSDSLELLTGSEKKTYSNSENMGASMGHTLYRSIYSHVAVNQGITDSSGGKITMTNATGSLDYRKQIYRGSFNAGVWKSFNNMDRLGALTLLQDQQYSTAIAGNPFILSDRYVDENTIQIKIIDPNGVLDEEILVKDVHYRATTSVDTTRIDILPPLPGLYNFAQLDNYTLLLNYSFLNTNFELATDSQGFSLQLSTLDGLLSPNYSFSRSTQKLMDGVLPGGVNNSDSHTAGLTVAKDPYLAGIQYTRTYASRNSEKRWYGIGEYRQDLTVNTKINARLETEHNTYYPGEDEQPSGNYTPEKVYTATLSSSTDRPKQFLTINMGLSYSRRFWVQKTSAYSFFSNLNWRLGKVDANLGALYSGSSTTTTTGSTSESTTTVLYLNLKRKLF